MTVNDDGLEAAADVLNKAGLHHFWFKGPPDWRDLDPIGKSEFLSIVEQIVAAYLAKSGDGKD